MTEDQDSGQAILRRALATRNRKFNISLMARDLSIAPSALEEFAHGTASLTPEVLKALAGIVLDADYDPNSRQAEAAGEAGSQINRQRSAVDHLDHEVADLHYPDLRPRSRAW